MKNIKCTNSRQTDATKCTIARLSLPPCRTVGREAEFGGKACPPGRRRESAACVENECAVDGEWAQWAPWGYCDR